MNLHEKIDKLIIKCCSVIAEGDIKLDKSLRFQSSVGLNVQLGIVEMSKLHCSFLGLRLELHTCQPL